MPTLNILHGCATIQLTRGLNTLIDAADFAVLSARKWCATRSGTKWYARRSITRDGSQHKTWLHRVIVEPSPGFIVDHISGDGLDNRRENLRIATHSLNLRNRGKPRRVRDTPSRFKGVYRHKRSPKWRAEIRQNGRSHHLGLFASEEEAAKAYDIAARERFGEFARLNFLE